MNIKTLLLVTAILTSTEILMSQNKPAPEYLTRQDFPDSVMSTVLYAMDGEQTKFSEILNQYQGQTMVLDFWASWCRDCIVSIPGYNKLRKKVKKKNVVFLLLSVDKEVDKWKNAVDKYSLKGKHYRFDLGWKNPLSNYVTLDWIPRYIVIDESGKIIKPKFTDINDNALIETLTKTNSN